MSARSSAAAQSFTLAAGESIRQPQRVSLSADAERIAYVVGDTLWIARASDGGAPRFVADGMRQAAGTMRPFHALSAHGERLVFVRGQLGKERAWIAELGAEITLRPLLPDSLAARMMLFQHFAAGGPSFSPDGRELAFLAGDRTKSEPLQVFIADLASGTIRQLTKDRRMHYSVAFSPDGRNVAVAAAGEKPGSATLALWPVGGASPRDVRRIASAYLTDLLWSPDGSRIASYTAGGSTLVFQIAQSSDEPPLEIRGRRFVAWTADGAGLIGTRREGMSSRVIVHDVKRLRTEDITGADTVFSAIAAASDRGQTLLAFTAESGTFPRDVWTAHVSARGMGSRARITEANPGLDARLPATSRIFRWRVADGRTVEAQLFLPLARGPFPLVVIPYGGYSNDFPAGEYFLDAGIFPLIARGYAVVRPNTRGAASEETPPGQYGAIQLLDTEAMLDAMLEQKLIDGRRVAVIGHSHGGAMAYYYATHSGRFCAAAAINGRADWELQARSGDGFLLFAMGGAPDSLAERYRQASPLRGVVNARAALLAVTGMTDTQILPANGRSIVDALKAVGKPAELLEFPGEGHVIAEPTNRAFLWDRIFALLERECRSRS